MMSVVEKVLLLKGIDLFAEMPGEELAAIAMITEETRAGAGERVVSDGDQGDALYFVVAGTARVVKGDRTVAELGERAVFGELALLDPGPRTASVEAVTPLTLLRIGRDEFVEILSTRPEVPLGVIRMLARRLRGTLEK
jgi:CRP-like cAMP-binding protein